MINKACSLAVFIVFSAALYAQPVPQHRISNGAPTGSCGANWLDTDFTNGNLYSCNAGSWVLVTGGGGGTPCVTTALSFQFNNAGSFGCVPDVTFSTPHTVLTGASGIWDWTAMSGSNFKTPASIALTTPNLGTPSAISLTNATNFPATIVQTGQANTYTTGLQDLSNNAVDLRIPNHAADPGSCSVGQMYYNTGSSLVKACLTTNTWTAFSASSGLADPGGNGYVVRTALNTTVARTFSGGTYLTVTNADGTGGNSTFDANTALLLTQVTAQAGTELQCADAGASGTVYSCTPTPAPGSYVDKQAYIFTPNTSCAGGSTTLNVNALGAKQVYSLIDTTNPAANDCRAHQPIWAFYCASCNAAAGAFIMGPLANSGSGGITQLTGDVTAGPGSGSQAATVVQIEGAAIPVSAPFVGTNSSKQLILSSPFTTNAQTATYPVVASDFSSYKTIVVASGTFTITLLASAPPVGQTLDIINYGSGTVTVARNGLTINGAASNISIPPPGNNSAFGWHIVSDAANYEAVPSCGLPSGMTIQAVLVGSNGNPCPAAGGLAVINAAAGLLMNNTGSPNQPMEYFGGQITNSNGTLGSSALMGGWNNGAGGANSLGGAAAVIGGPNAGTNVASSAGNGQVIAGSSYGATPGFQGNLLFAEAYAQVATVTLNNLMCPSGTAVQSVVNCGANPTNPVGVAIALGPTTALAGTVSVLVAQEGSDVAVVASSAVTVNHYVAAGATAGQVTDCGSIDPYACPAGTVPIGIVRAVACPTVGCPKYGDDNYSITFGTLSTTLPLVHIQTVMRLPFVSTQTVSGADYTNTTVTPSTVFSWTLPATAAARSYDYSCDILWESTAATLVGPVFGLNLSAAPTQLTGAAKVHTALAGTFTTGYLSNTTTGSQTLITSAAAGVTSTNYEARIWGTIEGAAVAGSTFIINAAATSGSTANLNIRRGSRCTMHQTP